MSAGNLNFKKRKLFSFKKYLAQRILLLVFLLSMISLPEIAFASRQNALSYSNISQPTATLSASTTFVRIRALDSSSRWDLQAGVNNAPSTYNANQVLAWLSALPKGSVLERYFTGLQVPGASVPVCSSCAPMNVAQFLNASAQACSCIIVPRLTLEDYDLGSLFSISENYLSLPIFPKLQYLSLDNWGEFNTNHTKTQIIQMFQQLYAQGWKEIGINDCPQTFYSTFGYATFADFCVSPSNNFQPDLSQMQTVEKNESQIKTFLLYIDFPKLAQEFTAQSTKAQFSELTQIAESQTSEGFHFVYVFDQGFWDSNTITNGTMTEFQLENILINKYDQPTQTTTTSSSYQSSSSSSTTSSSSLSISSTSTSSTSTTTSSSTLNSATSKSSIVSSARLTTTATSSSAISQKSAAGILSALLPSRDPPVAYGFYAYEIWLIGGLAFVLVQRRGKIL